MLVRRVALLRNVPRAVVGRVGIPPPLLRALVPSVRVSTSAVQSPLLVLILVLVLNGRGRQTTPATQCAAALCPLRLAGIGPWQLGTGLGQRRLLLHHLFQVALLLPLFEKGLARLLLVDLLLVYLLQFQLLLVLRPYGPLLLAKGGVVVSGVVVAGVVVAVVLVHEVMVYS